jgi:hypothetical protein
MPQEVAERSGFSYNAILRAIRGGELHAVEPVCDLDQLTDSYSRCLGRGSPPAMGDQREMCPSIGRDVRLEGFRPAAHAKVAVSERSQAPPPAARHARPLRRRRAARPGGSRLP